MLPLFGRAAIAAAFPAMNARRLTREDGRTRPLYPEMLDLLLRLNIRAAADVAGSGADGFDLGTEIAKRTREVLEPFERDPRNPMYPACNPVYTSLQPYASSLQLHASRCSSSSSVTRSSSTSC